MEDLYFPPQQPQPQSPLLDALRLINRQYGPMTQRTQAGVGREAEMRQGYLPTTGERIGSAILDYGPLPAKMAVEIAKQPYYTGLAMADAYEDPTIGKVANAGSQFAMSMLQPAKAAGILLGGAGVVAAKESGMFGSSAEAAGLTPEQQARKAQLQKKISAGQWDNRSERLLAIDEMKGLQKIESDAAGLENTARIESERTATANRLEAERKAQEQKQTEYNSAVDTATALRDSERKRDTRWSDTAFGKYYNETGGAPAWAAAFAGGAGVLDRLAKGAPKTRGDYARLGVEGAGAASIPINAPLVYNATATEPDNPQRRALEVYARELPNDHPEKQYWMDQANKLPTANPVRETAQKELYDPLKFGERIGMAVAEGAPTAMTAANVPGALASIGRGALSAAGRTGEAIGGIPGRLAVGYQRNRGEALTELGNAEIARQASASAQANALKSQRLLAEEQSRLGAGTGGQVQSAQAAPQQQMIAGPQHQGQLQPPVPAQNPSPQPQQVTTSNGWIIPDSITSNKTRISKVYADNTSEPLQKYVLDKAKSGISPDAIVRKDVAAELNVPPNRTSAALKNLQEFGAANGLDVSDPKVLRAIAQELKTVPQYMSGKRSKIYGLGGVGVGVGYGAMPGEDQ